MASVFQSGNTAVITGGASGIGLALAKRCVAAGMKVLIADISDEALSSAASSANITTVKVDVSSTEDWARVKETVQTELGGKIHLLALNAGRSVKSDWTDAAAFRKTLDTNLYGVVNGIASLLPVVQETAAAAAAAGAAGGSAKTAVVITGSKQGITNPPGNPAYNASKAAVKTVAEHLSWDLRGTPEVAVHLLVPGWTFTGLTGASGTNEKPAGAWSPEQVVEYLEKKMGEGKFYVICPDNDVSEETDKKRMLWSVGDIVQGRPPLTRWRDEFKEEAKEWLDKQQL
jgi:NAD(P)-dependent dehydrogenase (short-subunit alcohol dehydrogenase family)